jgi:hypothetical protein
MPPELRSIVDQLYQHDATGRLWVGPCGHFAASMWTDDGGTIRCAAEGASTHRATDLHFAGRCSDPESGCHVEKCGRTYGPDDLPPAASTIEWPEDCEPKP